MVAGSQQTTTSVVGTSIDYPAVRAYAIDQGLFFNFTAVDQALRVVVLGAQTATDLKLGSNPVGATVTIDTLPFQVIGVLQSKGAIGAVANDDMALIPITTMQHYFDAATSVRSIGVSVQTAEQIPIVRAEIAAALDGSHHIASGSPADFVIDDQAQLLGTVANVGDVLAVLLAGVAAIALLVGGIGIMNIMLVSVRERTREIGIRKALGARSRDIAGQFLVEALTIALLGGFVGVAGGVVVSAAIGVALGWGVTIDPLTVVAALLAGVAVGCFFGVWPAVQASRLDPVAALRSE